VKKGRRKTFFQRLSLHGLGTTAPGEEPLGSLSGDPPVPSRQCDSSILKTPSSQSPFSLGSILGPLLVLLILAGGLSAFSKSDRNLPKVYREWLNRDVAYIISKEEKDAFLRLTSDAARDEFMKRFWDVRNPTPGSPDNPYKDEIYKRIAYADQYFGQFTDGWRSDRGRIYITLGPPKQRAYYTDNRNLRPMEIWFYSASEPSLPPYFYVVFYRPHAGMDYKLYSPYMDGPDKLVTTNQVVNNRIAAIKVIADSVGDEVARTTLSLLPDEPVDFQSATSSLQSDVLLSHILDLANDPLLRRQREQRQQLMASVTTRLILGNEYLDVLTVPLRDPEGNTNLDYVLRLRNPEDFTLGRTKDGRYYYSVLVTARVLDADGKQIFEQERKLSKYLNNEEYLRMKSSVVGYEGWLPLAPGKYKIEFVFTNQLKHTAYRAVKEVQVPASPSSGFRMTPLVAFSDMHPIKQEGPDPVPFAAAGMKFSPLLGDELILSPAENLDIFYQIWAPPSTVGRSAAGQKLKVDYAFGRLGLRGEAKVINDEVAKNEFDQGGSLINGKKIPLADLPEGNYTLSVSLMDPETRATANATLGFRVSSEANPNGTWDIVDEGTAADQKAGLMDYWRGLCYLAQGQKDSAIKSFLVALKQNPASEDVRARLADLYFGRKDFAQVAALYPQTAINAQTQERTILCVAESLDKIGETKKAISLLEAALNTRGSSGELYLALSSYYQHLGDLQKAGEMEQKGKSLMAKTAPKS
jgi:GWxTD domain-containing protein